MLRSITTKEGNVIERNGYDFICDKKRGKLSARTIERKE